MPFAPGPERSAWDALFDDATMCEMSELFMRLAPGHRPLRRRALLQAVVPRLAEAGPVPMDQVIGDIEAVRIRLTEQMTRCARTSLPRTLHRGGR